MPTSLPTLRSIARSLGLSRTTVSDSLRGSVRVDPGTAARVREEAEKVGYRRNPLAAQLMSELRKSKGGEFRCRLVALDLWYEGRSPQAEKFHAALATGAEHGAFDLGYKVQRLQIDAAQLASGEVNRLLREQDAHGVILLPTAGEPDFSAIDWSALAGVYMDYALKDPPLNLVYTDHYRSLIMALNELRALGYVRPGLIQKEAASARLHYRWAAAMRAFQCHCLDVEAIDPLVIPTLTQAAFTRWFKRAKPDVVLAHDVRVIEWMEECGAQVPKTHGFVCLNIAMTDRRCTGLDQQPESLGTRGAEIVIAQLQRNERGIPVEAAATTMPARWVAGPTVRPMTLRTVATTIAPNRSNQAVELNSA